MRPVKPLPASKIQRGSWSARWGDWVICLRPSASSWQAIVWRWTVGGGLSERTQLGAMKGFATPVDATSWACDVLRDSGARVMVIDRPSITLVDLILYNPAPEALDAVC